VSPSDDTVRVRVDEHILQLSNLDKVLYPETGFAKRDVIELLLADRAGNAAAFGRRPLTLRRYPNGVDGKSFLRKECADSQADMGSYRTASVPGSTMNREEIVFSSSKVSPVWSGSPIWPAWNCTHHSGTVGPRGAVKGTDLLVFDLDPGAPAGIAQCRRWRACCG